MAGFGRTLVVAVFVSVVIGACADGGADHLLLDRFFAASRLRDRTALARLSTVVFEPRQDGIVERITVLSSTEPRRLDGNPRPHPPRDDDSARVSDRVARLSLDTDLEDVSVPPASTIVARQITAQAQLRHPGGGVGERLIRITVQRAETHHPRKIGRWIITAFE